jgi:hypothetical protein
MTRSRSAIVWTLRQGVAGRGESRHRSSAQQLIDTEPLPERRLDYLDGEHRFFSARSGRPATGVIASEPGHHGADTLPGALREKGEDWPPSTASPARSPPYPPWKRSVRPQWRRSPKRSRRTRCCSSTGGGGPPSPSTAAWGKSATMSISLSPPGRVPLRPGGGRQAKRST